MWPSANDGLVCDQVPLDWVTLGVKTSTNVPWGAEARRCWRPAVPPGAPSVRGPLRPWPRPGHSVAPPDRPPLPGLGAFGILPGILSCYTSISCRRPLGSQWSRPRVRHPLALRPAGRHCPQRSNTCGRPVDCQTIQLPTHTEERKTGTPLGPRRRLAGELWRVVTRSKGLRRAGNTRRPLGGRVGGSQGSADRRPPQGLSIGQRWLSAERVSGQTEPPSHGCRTLVFARGRTWLCGCSEPSDSPRLDRF
jgi:hypothetical protein